jgi:GAG-polyprotein viral zinc-finger/Zinc knuckle
MLNRQSVGTNNRCFLCGESGHFAKDCYQGDDSDYESEDESDYEDDDTCFRCGRSGHFASSCYASTDVNGDYL